MIEYAEDVNGSEVEWTLGAAISEIHPAAKAQSTGPGGDATLNKCAISLVACNSYRRVENGRDWFVATVCLPCARRERVSNMSSRNVSSASLVSNYNTFEL